MSWHCVGARTSDRSFAAADPSSSRSSPGIAARSAALSAPVGLPVPPRAFTMLSSIGFVNCGGSTICLATDVGDEITARLARRSIAAMSSGAAPCDFGAVRSFEDARAVHDLRGLPGFASGTWMTSMRKSDEFGSCPGSRCTPAALRPDGRRPSRRRRRRRCPCRFGSSTTVCVCEPRQVCTLAMYFGFAMSVMSKMRMPRRRSLLTASFTPSPPQSSRPPLPSPDTNSRFL